MYIKIGPLLLSNLGGVKCTGLPAGSVACAGGGGDTGAIQGCVLWMSSDACRFKWAWLRGGGGALGQVQPCQLQLIEPNFHRRRCIQLSLKGNIC